MLGGVSRKARGVLTWIAVLVVLVVLAILKSSRWQTPNSYCSKSHTRNIVLVIVYNHPLYTSIPILRRLYGHAFQNVVFCGPKGKNKIKNVEYIYHNKGYFGYMCLARAMEMYPPHHGNHVSHNHGYLLINDDVMLNFWNIAGYDKAKIWEGPKAPIEYAGLGPSKKWYWWQSRWGLTQCKKAFDDIWLLKGKFNLWFKMNISRSLELLAINGQRHYYCYRGRSDIYYVPQAFSEMFQLLATIFYKHSVFLEIAVPTILRMLDLEEDFEFIPGIYLPGRVNDSSVKDSMNFRTVYNKDKFFVHPMKLNYNDSKANKAFLEETVFTYIKNNCNL